MISPKKKYLSFFNEAKKVSKYAQSRVKIGAAIVHNRNILSSAYNMTNLFGDMTKLYGSEAAIHAEVAAILKVKNKNILQHCEIFIYRESLNGDLRICKPCKTCQRILRSFGLTKIHYTTPEGYHYEEI